MKTTLELPDELLIEAKKRAAEQRRPLRALVEEGLRLALRKPEKQSRKKQVRLITVKGGLPRHLDLSSREAMHQWLDERSECKPDRAQPSEDENE
jgi:hypothetical protein